MAESYVQGAFVLLGSAGEAALLAEAFEHAADLMGELEPAAPSQAFLAAFPSTVPDDPFATFTGIFADAAFPDFGAEIHVVGHGEDGSLRDVSILGLTDFQPEAIGKLLQHCCRQSLVQAPIGFEWSYSATRAYPGAFGGGWCRVFADRCEFGSTRQELARVVSEQAGPAIPPNDHWSDDPAHPVSNWQAEIANDDTRLGYLAWKAARQEMFGPDMPE